MSTRKPAADRFWAKVQITPSCWLWTAGVNTGRSSGYGTFWTGTRTTRAHIWAYERLVGPVAAGMQLDHTCFERRCVNPAHLRQVTNKQNSENRSGPYSSSSSRVRGVHRHRKQWNVRVEHYGVRHYGGTFATIEEAEPVAIALRLRLFTHNELDRALALTVVLPKPTTTQPAP